MVKIGVETCTVVALCMFFIYYPEVYIIFYTKDVMTLNAIEMDLRGRGV